MSLQFLVSVVTALVMVLVILTTVAYLILLERKIAAWIQDRIGPNRVGPLGLLQPAADGLKMFLKEDYTPGSVERVLFVLAPILAAAPALLGWAVMPWGGYLQWGDELAQVAVAPINIGAIYVLAIGSLAVYGVVVGGYASNNKYAFLGGLRGTAQMLSYEIPLGLTVLIVILMSSTARADGIALLQNGGGVWNVFTHPLMAFADLLGMHGRVVPVWNVFAQPLLAIIFFACGLAETNRAPFDLPEAEQELVAGYHTEYSSMKFGLFMLGEYMHMITSAAFLTLLFLGGWSVSPLGLWPDLPAASGLILVLVKAAVFFGKVMLLVAAMMWVRWTLPRFRFDQLMRLAWRGLIPITLALLVVSGALVYLERIGRIAQVSWWMYAAANLAVALGALVIGPLIPAGPPVNRRIRLAGSRFSPPAEEAKH